MSQEKWGDHVYSIGSMRDFDVQNVENCIKIQKQLIEPWLSAVFQSEHLSLLIGSGLSLALAELGDFKALDMNPSFDGFFSSEKLEAAATKAAQAASRGKANIEDQIRVTTALIEGLQILGELEESTELATKLNELLSLFLEKVARTEEALKNSIEKQVEEVDTDAKNAKQEDDTGRIDPLTALVSFLLSFASRTASRERLHIFTTNYDRYIEFGADHAGLHLLDRFVGGLEPLFRSSRLDIDMHYNPPGIRGEPRYLEGVVRLTKLHGSIDWMYSDGFVKKVGLPFGPPSTHPMLNSDVSNSVMIYPNSAKDRETTEYPYVELFRDYAAAVCRPNSVLVTFGYGFGDEHINRTIADMLTIPSTHLVIISYGDDGGRISSFYRRVSRSSQISLLIGPHFGDLEMLVNHYLPKPAIDRITMRKTLLLRNRDYNHPTKPQSEEQQGDTKDEPADF